MAVRALDDKSSDTLVVVSGEGFWTGSSTLPHLHHFFRLHRDYPLTFEPPVGSVVLPRYLIYHDQR